MKKRSLYLLLPVITLILEILPYGAVLHFGNPEGEPWRKTFSYFDPTPFGYANFAPLLTAVITCVVFVLLAVYCLTGKRRKTSPSKEGLLGVEGMDNQTVIAALERAGADFEDVDSPRMDCMQLTKADLMAAGLSGTPDSAARRQALLQVLELPSTLSTNRLLEVVNATVTPAEWAALLHRIEENEKG